MAGMMAAIDERVIIRAYKHRASPRAARPAAYQRRVRHTRNPSHGSNPSARSSPGCRTDREPPEALLGLQRGSEREDARGRGLPDAATVTHAENQDGERKAEIGWHGDDREIHAPGLQQLLGGGEHEPWIVRGALAVAFGSTAPAN